VAVLSLADYQQVFGKPRVLPTRLQVLSAANSVVQHLGELDKAGLVSETLSQAQSGGTAMLVKTTSGSRSCARSHTMARSFRKQLTVMET
jgi:hypothetical protein